MTKAIATLTTAVLSIAISIMPATAFAQGRGDNRWQGGPQNRHWDPANTYRPGGNHRERRLSRNDEIYRGHDGRHYCRRSDGSTGLVIGAISGGLLGRAIGGDSLSALLGAGGGAVLGRSIDRGKVRCR
jgi:hypothetical protein